MINDNLKFAKYLNSQGQCLHFDSGNRCGKTIKAHSIQKSHLLNSISDNGHVYRLSADFSTMKKNEGLPQIKKIGINKVSTFSGFCNYHDNKLFKLIDQDLFEPVADQILLYSYRSLCRELFVKKNAINFTKKLLEDDLLPQNKKRYLLYHLRGNEKGYNNLCYHKEQYDQCLKYKNYQDLYFVSFLSVQKPIILFSGLLCPDYDFLSNRIQNLLSQTAPLALITFFSAITKEGWAYVFAWHKTSNEICSQYMRTLATCISEKNNTSDLLFRYIFSCCENHAISPIWWEKLDNISKNQILEKIMQMFHPNIPINPDYLSYGLEGISPWCFSNVVSKITYT